MKQTKYYSTDAEKRAQDAFQNRPREDLRAAFRESLRDESPENEEGDPQEGSGLFASPEETEETEDTEELTSSREKAKKTETVYVPQLVNMDHYLMDRYKKYILQELNIRLANGEISQIVGRKVRSEQILFSECAFRNFSYWRLNKCDFLIDIEMRLELRVDTPAGVDLEFFAFYLELWFSFCEDEETCELERIGLLDRKPEHDGTWKLDKYLVPVLRRDEIDQFSENLWMEYYRDAARDQSLRKSRDLAAKLHLAITNIPLYHQSDVRSVLFFQDTTVLAQAPRAKGEQEDPPPYEVKVKANTIVINTHHKGNYGFDLDIFHECIHSEWHYLFFRLQNMYSDDMKQMKTVKRTVSKEPNSACSVRYMEYQARYGSYGLMMPRTFMHETIQSMYKEVRAEKRKDGTFDHDGRRYDTVARKIAGLYTLSKSHVRARMIQLGYTAAIGALNYVDGDYITPFAFSDVSNRSGEQTYVIGHKAIADLYQKDPEFRRIMQTGQFAYVDGHVVFCEGNYVIQTPRGAVLSGWANAHIDRVSLRFSRTYTGNHHYTYTFGRMNSKETVDKMFGFLDPNSSMTLRERQQAADWVMKDMPLSFHAALTHIMNKVNCTVDALVGRIPISRSTLLRFRTEERKQYKLDEVIAICIGLHLPPWLSEVLLQRARLTVDRVGPYGYYGIILDCFYMDTIADVAQYLEDNDYPPLDLKLLREDAAQDQLAG